MAIIGNIPNRFKKKEEEERKKKHIKGLCRNLQEFWDFKIASLKNLLQKSNKKLKRSDVPKTEDCKTDLQDWGNFYCSLVSSFIHFKIRPPKATGNTLQISFTPKSKANIWVIVKEFLKPEENIQVYVNELPLDIKWVEKVENKIEATSLTELLS